MNYGPLDKVVAFVCDRRVLVRDMVRDNPATMRREALSLDGGVADSWAADAIEQERVRDPSIPKWGFYPAPQEAQR